jgi:uncharacterized membrane protein (GlpM family)
MDPAEWVLPDDGDRFQLLKCVFNKISTMDNIQEVRYFNNIQSSQSFNEYFVLNTTIFLFTYMLQYGKQVTIACISYIFMCSLIILAVNVDCGYTITSHQF